MKERLKIFKEVFDEITQDTLKTRDEDGVVRWSRTSLTMFSAWFVVMYIAIWDFHKFGYRPDVFFGLLGVAVGVKISDSVSKKIKK